MATENAYIIGIDRYFPTDYLKERIYFHTRKPLPAQKLQLVFTEDEENKCVRGAAVYAGRKLRLWI